MKQGHPWIGLSRDRAGRFRFLGRVPTVMTPPVETADELNPFALFAGSSSDALYLVADDDDDDEDEEWEDDDDDLDDDDDDLEDEDDDD